MILCGHLQPAFRYRLWTTHAENLVQPGCAADADHRPPALDEFPQSLALFGRERQMPSQHHDRVSAIAQ